MMLISNQMTTHLSRDLYPFLTDSEGNRLHWKQKSVEKDTDKKSEQNRNSRSYAML